MVLFDIFFIIFFVNFNGVRERNISFGSNEFDEREDDDDIEGF